MEPRRMEQKNPVKPMIHQIGFQITSPPRPSPLNAGKPLNTALAIPRLSTGIGPPPLGDPDSTAPRALVAWARLARPVGPILAAATRAVARPPPRVRYHALVGSCRATSFAAPTGELQL